MEKLNGKEKYSVGNQLLMVAGHVNIVGNHLQVVNILRLGKMVTILTAILNVHIVEEPTLKQMSKK